METITKKTRSAIAEKLVDEFMPLARELEKEGVPEWRIRNIVGQVMNNRVRNYYKHDRTAPLSSGMRTVLDALNDKCADSKAETIFYNMLLEKGVDFDFQVKIGKYRVDFLFDNLIVFKGDGPHHNSQVEYDRFRDKFLESMGYQVMRMRWTLVAQMPDIVIEVIQDELKEIKRNKGGKNG